MTQSLSQILALCGFIFVQYHLIIGALDSKVDTSWQNATVFASPLLNLQLTTGDDPLRVDAVITIQLNAEFTVTENTTVDDAKLAKTLDGTWSTSFNTSTNLLTIQRNGNGSNITSATPIEFALQNVINPKRVGRFDVGSMQISDPQATFTRTFALSTIEIDPGGIWKTQMQSENYLSGRNTSLTIHFTPAHAIPSDGAIALYMPTMYKSLSQVSLSSQTGLNGDLILSAQSNLIWMKRHNSSTTSTVDMQDLLIELNGIVHPFVEGPMGRSMLLQTFDGSSCLIDQTYIDTSAILLSKAHVEINPSSLRVKEGDATGTSYTLSLNAPPYGDTALFLLIEATTNPFKVLIEPSSVIFSTLNWSIPVNISVIPVNDDIVTPPMDTFVLLRHSIQSGDTLGTFNLPNDVSVYISEDDYPAVHLSNRFLAVVEGLRNDSYGISLQSQPTDDVIVHFTPLDPFLQTSPDQLVFTPNGWNHSKLVTVMGIFTTSTRAATSGIRHHLTSTDANYNQQDDQIFPQNQILVYYEPLTMESCIQPCRAGWFPVVNVSTGDSQCLGCPPGHYCPGSCTAPVSCPRGTSSTLTLANDSSVCQACAKGMYAPSPGLSLCLSCPAGAMCNDTTASPQPCPPGSYSNTNEAQCHDCPAGTYNNQVFQSQCTLCPRGFYCPKGSIDPIACLDGTYSMNLGAAPCTTCPAGFECVDPTIGPVACSQGTFSLVNSTGCTVCPSGYSCSSSAQAPQPCGRGSYSALGSISCQLCPRGHACNNISTSEPLACVQGTYSSVEGATMCQLCPAGYSCVDVAQSPMLCELGSYSIESQPVCHVCPAGTYCPDQYTAPVACAPGTYSVGNATGCTPCQAGTPCVRNDAAPVPCAPGSYSIDAFTPCERCEAGSSCPSPSQPPIKCAQGTYSLPGAVDCLSCPFGYSCTPSGTLTACALGQTNSRDHSVCIACPKGYDCSPLNSAQTPCALGTYSLEGDGECLQCPKGYKCVTTMDPPVQCTNGTYSIPGSIECLDCLAGFYCPHPSSLPLVCPAYHYSTKASSLCTPCPAGMDCSSSVLPVPCPTGTYSLGPASPCLSCPAGSACGSSTSAPTLCDPGTYSAPRQAKCTPCGAGFSCPQSGQTTQLPCLTGTYALGGATTCTTCPAGMQCPVTTQAIKEACPAGTYSLGGQARCLLCPLGSMCPSVDGSQNVICAPGSYSLGGAVQCTLCPAGSACPDALSSPLVCPDGYYSLRGAKACSACPAGFACPDPTTSLLVPCAKGTYATGGARSCTPCPAGYSCYFTNSSSLEACQAGYYSTIGSGTCIECPQGYYCDAPSENPKLCAVGYYSLRASSSCLACPPGYECPRSDQVPQPCPIGFYSQGTVATCRSCSPGYKCSLASTSPTPTEDACPMGGYCNPPTTFSLCPAGTFGNVTAGESIDHACAPCPEGSYCEMGSTPRNQTTCPAGFFCPEGTQRATQYPCPPGTFNPAAGQKHANVCQVCPAGSYCLTGSSVPQICPQGYYCLEGTRSMDAFPCPAGSYSGKQTGLTNQMQCKQCPLGSYCPEASSAPTKCPAGTYNPETGAADGHECRDCPPGWSCPHVGQWDYVDRCTQGHYCPGGTVLATDHPCPAGTYTEQIDLIRSQDCTMCPERHACLQGTGAATQPMLECAPGFFCPNGTSYATEFPCLPGTWSSSTLLSTATECEICPPGQFCQGGKAFIDGACAPGHYCPFGTSSSVQFPCPSGTYTAKTGLFEPSQCDDCPPGFYCPAGSVTPIPCKPGSYTSMNNTKTVGPGDVWPACVLCPAGSYCLEASIRPEPCGKGQFSTSGAKACLPCEAGYFCSSETTSAAKMRSNAPGWSNPGALYGTCYNGTYCPSGFDREPALETDACPAGSFCPTATPAPILCPAGTYSNLTGQDSMSDCIPTPAGYFSLAGALAPTGSCQAGFYCPIRSTSQTQVPCPARFYLDRSLGQGEDDCALCLAGAYCPIGTAYPIVCPAGYYCPTGLASPAPCPIGTYANSTGLRKVDECLPCPPGMYCDSTARTVPRGLCDPGYYCTLGASTSAPINYASTTLSTRFMGDLCPQGAYCPLGSSRPTMCPSGTFSNLTGLESMSQCVSCPPGNYCQSPGLFVPSGSCDPGYFCIGGATLPTQMESPRGSFSLQGATAPSPCLPGQYNLYPAQAQCIQCPAGFYCSGPGTTSPTGCPSGNYCPQGTSLPLKCSPGTFAAALNLVKQEQCEPCPLGMYCDSYGLSAPSGPCLAGFVCLGGSPLPTPVAQTYGDVCPRASYCPEGTTSAILCPTGSFRATTGGTSLASCSPCPGGKYCSSAGLIQPSGSCFSGYYCVSNASSPTPTDTVTGAICPAGFYCPQASSAPIQCSAGTFTGKEGQAACETCPMGYFCDGIATRTYVECPMGHFCPQGTAASPLPCPIGTFSNNLRLTNVTECLECLPGFYCDRLRLVQPTGLCAAGFYCPAGSESAFGKNQDNDMLLCPRGFYCLEGTAWPLPCPRGTYSNRTGLVQASECVYCDEGSYCSDSGLATPSGVCDPGYYCQRNNTQSNPSSGVVTLVLTPNVTLSLGGQACPLGSYCPKGSVRPLLCPEGSYTNVMASSTCQSCPAGYFCPLGCTDYLTTPCPLGHYCLANTERGTQFPCPPGTFGNRTGLQDQSQCTPAPGGTFVEDFAASKPSGPCRSGFYCSGGSATSTPVETTSTGGPCLPGSNCPEGSAIPIVCNAGSYCSSTNIDAALPCNEGFYCVQGSYTASPTRQSNALGLIGDICPSGHYCPQGTSNPIPCLPGTFAETTQNSNATFCLPCPRGFICRTSGLSKPFEQCPAGFVCAGGESTATTLCPQGFACPEGSFEPHPCPAGTFADETGLGACKVCPERYYCDQESRAPIICPQGYYCPQQTSSSTQYPCVAGTFGDRRALASANECASCPRGYFCSGFSPTNTTSGTCAPGHYCSGNATTAEPVDGITGGLCEGGYVCFGGAWVPDPIDGITGSLCERGYYCPQGSSTPSRCRKGSYNSLEQQSSCATCPAGSYCDTNATLPVPCPLRSYCPEGIQEPIACPNGTYGHELGLASATDCAPCSAGNFCVAGTLTASCTAGYYCKVHNDQPNPMNLTTLTWQNERGGPCPIGYYCPEGVVSPLPCPSNTSRLERFGMALSDCTSCPAGKTCEDGTNTLPCPAGSYCPYSMGAIPCPMGTYNPDEGKAILEECGACDAGKVCNRTGIITLTDYDCPRGHYCPKGSSEPQHCPAGTYRGLQGGKTIEDCFSCPGGSHCTEGTIEPVVCNASTYCPVHSGSPFVCPGGFYCPYNTTNPIVCPEGYFCFPGVALPSTCTLGHYCPPGTSTQVPCPLGYFGRETALNGAYTSLSSSCQECPPGTFGIDVNRTRCDACLEGYVCLGTTTTKEPTRRDVDRGYICPPGYYCPAQTSSELPCPSGTYQPNYQAGNLSSCLLCPPNSYQNAVGQQSCLPCSTSAFAPVGATTCSCIGNHRAFQLTDGYCICEPGFEFYDQDLILRSDEDGSVDCQPIVYDRCRAGQVRSNDGSCVSASSKACDRSCNNGTGTYVPSLGVCQCENQPDLDTICNSKCREEAPQIQVNSSTGQLQLYYPVTDKIVPMQDQENSNNLVSKVACPSKRSCQLHSLAVASSGFSGSYDIPPMLLKTPQSRRLSTEKASASSSSIPNPMVCLSIGDGLLFDLSVPRSYPIYLKDSMLNTNPSFDYGAFRALALKVNGNTSTVTAFAFSFTEPGTYVFGNSLNAGAQTIIVVMKAGTSCPTEAPILPLNEKNLITVSAKRRTDGLILAPDWGLIIGLLGGLMGMILVAIAGMYYFRTKSWTSTAANHKDGGYRVKSKQMNLATMRSKGIVAVNTSDKSGPDTRFETAPVMKQLVLGSEKPTDEWRHWEEEDLDTRELVDRLQFHHDKVIVTLEDQKGDVKHLMHLLQAEMIELKRLFLNALMTTNLMVISPPLGSKSETLGAALPVNGLSRWQQADKENFVVEKLERNRLDREHFLAEKTAKFETLKAGLGDIQDWGSKVAEMTSALVHDMAIVSIDAKEPEDTSTNDASTCLEQIRTVLDTLQTLLGSDPMTQTSSSLVNLIKAEKGRREVVKFVLEASQRAFLPPSAQDTAIQHLLELHGQVERAQNNEDEALLAMLPLLQKFGTVLPHVLASLDDYAANFRRDLETIREEQNPVKERGLETQLQKRLNKLLNEIAAGAQTINHKLENEATRGLKLRQATQEANSQLSRAVEDAKEEWTMAQNNKENDRALKVADIRSQSLVLSHEEAPTHLQDTTIFEIKELLAELTTLLRTHGVQSNMPSAQLLSTTRAEVEYREITKPRQLDESIHETQKTQAERQSDEDEANGFGFQYNKEAEESLELHFKEEEVAIEEEYLKELSTLEKEFKRKRSKPDDVFPDCSDTMLCDFETIIENRESFEPEQVPFESVETESETFEDEHADIVAQLDDVYAQAWKDRVQILEKERDVLGNKTHDLKTKLRKRKEVFLEEIVEKQDQMDALQEEAVTASLQQLRDQVETYRQTKDSSVPDKVEKLVVAARDAKWKGKNDLFQANVDLQHLRSAFEHDLMALKREIESKQQRFVATQNTPADVSSRNAEEQGENLNEQVLDQVQEKYLALQEQVEERKAQATIAIAVADSQVAYLDQVERLKAATDPVDDDTSLQSHLKLREKMLLEVLTDQLPGQIEAETQRAFDKLHANFALASNERRQELEADAASRKAKLVDKLHRRQYKKQVASLEQERAEMDRNLTTKLHDLDEIEGKMSKQLANELACALHERGKQVATYLRQEYNEAFSKLKPEDEQGEKRLEKVVANALDQLQDEAFQQEKAAIETRKELEREMERFKEERAKTLAKLTHTLEAEKLRQEQRLQQRLQQSRIGSLSNEPVGIIAKDQEEIERERLEEQLEAQAQRALEEERSTQQEYHDQLSQRLREVGIVEAAARATIQALELAREECTKKAQTLEESRIMDQEIARVQDFHVHSLKSRYEQLEAEKTARKAALIARIERKRRTAAGTTGDLAPTLVSEEQRELDALEHDEKVTETELKAAIEREKEMVRKAFQEAKDLGTAEMKEQLAAFKRLQEAEAVKFEQSLGGNLELERAAEQERQRFAAQQLQELTALARRLMREAEAQRLTAIDMQAAAEEKLKQLEKEQMRERRALTETAQDEAMGEEEMMMNQTAAWAQVRERQEEAVRLASNQVREAAAAVAKAASASKEAQDEIERVTADFDHHRRSAQQLQVAEMVHSKRKLADRLAEKKGKQQVKVQESEKREETAASKARQSVADETEELQIEAQLAACRQAHEVESAKLRHSLQVERDRQERALYERIARRKAKRGVADAQTVAKGDGKTADEMEGKQQQQDEEEAALATALEVQEREAWEAFNRKQEEDLRVLHERKHEQERKRAAQQHQVAQEELKRLEEEHERELQALTMSLAKEQSRQEEKLQQRIAQRRVRKQREEEEAAFKRANVEKNRADAEEGARVAAEREKTQALAEAQAQADAEAEKKEREEIIARIARQLEAERARQRHEKEELEARLERVAKEQAAQRAEALAQKLQQQASETADKMIREFDTNLRELRETHSADSAAQKTRLESRIAAKKARKLRELEEKRELERQRLHVRQQQEAEDALRAAAQEHKGARPDEFVHTSTFADNKDDARTQASQQEQDVAAVQELFTHGLVPLKLSLFGAIELVVGARQEQELATELAELATKKVEHSSREVQLVSQEKAARKTQALSELSRQRNDRDVAQAEIARVLEQIDSEFAEKLRQVEHQVAKESVEIKQNVEKRVKDRHLKEVAYLLAHFDLQYKDEVMKAPPVTAQMQLLEELQDPTTSQSLAAQVVKRLENTIEKRLAKIETLMARIEHIEDKRYPRANDNVKENQIGSNSYRLAIAQAAVSGCGLEKRREVDNDATISLLSFGVVDVRDIDTLSLVQVSASQLNEQLRARYDFAELLLDTMTRKTKEGEATLTIVENFGRQRKWEDYASYAMEQSKEPRTDTLFLSLAAVQTLSSGQLGIIMLHALTQACAHTSDLTEPRFISHMYAILMRCYQGLFTQMHREMSTETSSSLARKKKRFDSESSEKDNGKVEKGHWQARVQEMERFLTGFENPKTVLQSVGNTEQFERNELDA